MPSEFMCGNDTSWDDRRWLPGEEDVRIAEMGDEWDGTQYVEIGYGTDGFFALRVHLADLCVSEVKGRV